MIDAESVTPGAGSSDKTANSGRVRLMSTMPLFVTKVDLLEVPDHDRLNAGLLEEIALWRSEGPGESASNLAGWHSQRTLFTRQGIWLEQLRRHIRSATVSVLQRYMSEAELTAHAINLSGWVNVNGTGGYNVPHVHPGVHLSGCYYVRVPAASLDRSGAIEFLNPAGTTMAEGVLGERMVSQKVTVRPKEGQMLIFPSYLLHWVYPNQDPEERVSIAFNMRLASRPE